MKSVTREGNLIGTLITKTKWNSNNQGRKKE